MDEVIQTHLPLFDESCRRREEVEVKPFSFTETRDED